MAKKWPYANGKAPSSYLVEVEPGNHLRPDAAAAWVLFRAACYAATGVWLTITSANRSYERQVELFLERYTRTNTGRKSRVWNGVRYWLRAGAADAAVPSTSNHGWAIAVDMGGYARAWDWIVKNCGRFGFSLAEGLSVGEKWHIVFIRAWDGVLGGGGRIEDESLSNPSPATPGTPTNTAPTPAGPTQEELDDMAATKSAAIVRDYVTEKAGTVRTALIFPDGSAKKLSRFDDVNGAVFAHAKVYGIPKDNDGEKLSDREKYTQLTPGQWDAFWKAYTGRKVGFDKDGV